LGLTQLEGFLSRHRRIALDTSIFIYQLEANSRYLSLTDPLFAWLERPRHSAVTCTVTMRELLVLPYRSSNEDQVNTYYALLTSYPNLEWIAPTLQIADTAARVRAAHHLRNSDSLQAATAIHSGATGLVTNDQAFDRVREFDVLVLERLL
jgi:predicted nucleic acid-binding protein